MKSRLYNYDQGIDTILFNNKDILVDGKPLFIREWCCGDLVFVMSDWRQIFYINGHATQWIQGSRLTVAN